MSEQCMVCVDAGVCKMKTLIIAKENDMGMVEIEIKSDCPNILKMSWRLEPMSPYAEVEAEFHKSEVQAGQRRHPPHRVPRSRGHREGSRGRRRSGTQTRQLHLVRQRRERSWTQMSSGKDPISTNLLYNFILILIS